MKLISEIKAGEPLLGLNGEVKWWKTDLETNLEGVTVWLVEKSGNDTYVISHFNDLVYASTRLEDIGVRLGAMELAEGING